MVIKISFINMVHLGYLFLIPKENLDKVNGLSKENNNPKSDYVRVETPKEIEKEKKKRNYCLNCDMVIYHTKEKYCDIDCKVSLYFKLLDIEK